MNSVTSTTFGVSDVQRATEPLSEVPYRQAVEALLTTGIPAYELKIIKKMREVEQIMPLPDAPRPLPIEACSRYHGRLLGRVAYHPVIAAVHSAFMDHRPLCLSPDSIWLMFIQGVANHINAHAEKIRPRFVSHQGKLTIQVWRNDFVKGSPENPWSEVFHEFSEKIREHVGSTIDLFVPKFTTTGPVERAAAEVVLLDAMQSYFKYVLVTGCGIPTITLEGTPDDWEALAERVESFREFGLGWWLDALAPILKQFTRASHGDIDLPFWQSLYKYEGGSGGPKITGWITAFFPYKKDHHTGRANSVAGMLMRFKDRKLLAEQTEMMESMLSSEEKLTWCRAHYNTHAFPSGLSKAPFRWQYFNKTFDMEFLGGFVGVAQDQETLTLKPEIGWAVREAPAAG